MIPRSRCLVPAAIRRLTLAAAALLIAQVDAAPVAAQAFDAPGRDQEVYEYRTLTGTRMLGWIQETRGDTIVFRSFEGGEWRLDARSASLRRARGTIVNGEFWREDQNHSRLFFAPTGRTLHQGQAYIGIFTVLPFIGVGITDHVTMAGGFNPFGGELATMDLWLAPKVRVHADGTQQVAVGAFYLQISENPFDDDYSRYYDEWGNPIDVQERGMYRLAIGYGVGTFGTPDQAFHLGGGLARQFGSDPRTRALGMVGGEYRLSRAWKVISENWLMLPDYPMVSVGARSVGERWTYDLGLMALLGEEGAPYVPILSFSYAFGAGR
jgi:hypothetical protein